VEAVILILKHATFLRLSSNSSKLALTHAELDYQRANINLTIQRYLKSSSSEHLVEQFAGFIMATDISLFIPPSITTISHQAF
jgi:hypothetical protein